MNIALIVTIVLVMGVIFVNGWTDAPNAIATAVSTRVLRPNVAIGMAVAMNFFGALVMTFLMLKLQRLSVISLVSTARVIPVKSL
ncbi:hypothetical protein COSHB9_07570 [Companilactobacillus alimentarius]